MFFTAPLVAEYLLGDLPITFLPSLVILAPLYGGGALLIREVARRTQKGWPAIIILGMAYAIFEEAFTTQSLFNPNYLHLHLLRPAYVPSLGISAWWTLWMLNVHPIWSIGVPIALIEACVPQRARTPWLDRVGIAITAILFAVGAIMSTLISLKQDPFTASLVQFASAAVVCIAFITIALTLPPNRRPKTHGWVPSPVLAGLFALGVGSVLQIVPQSWGWLAFLSILVCDLVALVAVWKWFRHTGWSLRQQLALASGATLAYGLHSFLQQPVIATPASVVRAGNAIFLIAATCLVWFAIRRCRGTVAGVQ